jgi:hypothetical protein
MIKQLLSQLAGCKGLSHFFSLPWVSPFHRYTDLESDLFLSEYTDCPKVVEKGELLYRTSNKKVR